MAAPHIVSLGDLVMDLIFPVSLPILPSQHQDIEGMKYEPGGACNSIIMGARLGARMSAVGAVGTDAFGDALLDILRAEGANVDGVDAAPNSRTTLVLSLSDASKGQHVFVGAYGKGADAQFTANIQRIVDSADALFVQGYSLYEKRVADMVVKAIQRAKANNTPIYFDGGPTLHAVPSDRVDWAVGMATVLLATEDEIPGISQGRTGAEAVDYLLSRGAQMIVIKQGGNGCTVIVPVNGQAQSKHYPGFNVQVVDTIGAGDCFDAGFMIAQLSGYSIDDCAVMANACGAANVQKLGAGRDVPTRAEVNALLRSKGLSF